MERFTLIFCLFLLLPPSFLSQQQPLYGNRPKVWLTVSSLLEKVKVNGHKFVTKRKIELNWMNLPIPNAHELDKKSQDMESNKDALWVALFDHDQTEPDSESALVSLQPKMLSRGRFR
jgi:hypothetical protein